MKTPGRTPGMTMITLTLLAPLIQGCASPARVLMPTPTIYVGSGGRSVFDQAPVERRRPEVDLLYITDRQPENDLATGLPYGQQRSRSIGFGSAAVRMAPGIDWATLAQESQLAKRTQEIDLEMGTIREQGRFPTEPYDIQPSSSGRVVRDPDVVAQHQRVKASFQQELQRRLQESPSREVMLYVHGFNETFATAAYTAAELCHFLGRRQVCAFYTWPASSTGNFLLSYTTTTESAEYSVGHLKKAIRLIAQTPGVKGLQLLAHSRGTAVLLSALRELSIESIAAGIEPATALKIDNVVLMSPDIDVDVAVQKIEAFGSDPDLIADWSASYLPKLLRGRLTIYASPEDRALFISKWLFRSRNRVGQLRPQDIKPRAQRYFAEWGDMDLISYQGDRTDLFGHSYFTSNPQVSSDLIELVRYGRKPGDPGRPLIRQGPITWAFPGASRP